MPQQAKPVALITGGARRIGASIAHHLHARGFDLLLHYRSSPDEATALQQALESVRPDSVSMVQADLCDTSAPQAILDHLKQWRGRLDVLVNNASTFYPTPLGAVTEEDWDNLIGSNLKGPFFLSQALAPLLRKSHGCIVNLVDIYARRPLKDHPAYSIAKAGNAMMVKSLALELGPEVRVNGVAPGVILWPEQPQDEADKQHLLASIPLQRKGEADDIAEAVLFLIEKAGYMTGQVIAVDGGRSTGF